DSAAPPPPTEVTVVGTSLARTAGSAHIIGEKKLARFGFDDPMAVLSRVPGVYARGEDGFGLRPNIGLRGVNPDRSKKVTLMEDGVLAAPAPYSAPAAYYFPLMARVSTVRVIKGPAAISYGPQTIGGAIDLVTRDIPATFGGMIDLSTGEYGYGKVHAFAGSSDEHTGYLIEGVHLRNDGFKELPNGADTGFYRNEWTFKGNYVFDPRASAKNEVRLKLTYSDEVSNETYLGLSDADFRAAPLRRYGVSQLDRMKNHRTAVVATHVFEPTPRFSITTTAYRNDFSRTWRKVNAFRGASIFDVLQNPDDPRNATFVDVLRGEQSTLPNETPLTLLVGPNEREFTSQGIETRARLTGTTGPLAHRVEYGARLHNDRAERRHSQNGFLVQGNELVPDGGPTEVILFNEVETTALALHASDAMSWQGLTVTPGVRVETMRQTYVNRATRTEQARLATVVLPGVGAFYAFVPSFGALFGAHRGFSPAAPEAGMKVKPELSVNYEAGLRFSDRRTRVEVIAFRNDYSNMTDVCTQSSGCTEVNVDRQFDAGKARISGVEAFADREFALTDTLRLPLTISYTFTRSEFQSSFSSDDPIFGTVHAGDEIPYVPRHQASASLGLEHPKFGATFGASYVAAMREQAGSGPVSQGLATDEQLVFDMSGRYQVSAAVSIYAHVRNLTNEHDIVSHRPFGARPNAPRWVQAGLKIAF
ncbi:MAG TPA: TonB-dependent receptor, partial [Polyangiaceae bacterium]|nr:TonB-dependent receptor [Polyangiaceae bacterium]